MAKKHRNTVTAPLSVGKVVKAEDLKLKPREHKVSMYLPVVEAMRALKKGEAITVPLPHGSTYRQLANRLTSVIRNNEVKAPAGCFFSKRQTEEGLLAVSVLPVASPRKKKA